MTIKLDLLITVLDAMGVVLPYGVKPFNYGRLQYVSAPYPDITEQDWRTWRWNPPEGSPHLVAEEGASAKPTWKQLTAAAAEILQEQALQRLRTACQHRITRGYGEENDQDENHQRLRAMEPGADDELKRRIAAGNTQRDRHLTRYHAIKTWLHTLTDLDTLKNLTFETDDYWTTNWSPPA